MASETRTDANEQPPDAHAARENEPAERQADQPDEDNSLAVLEPGAPGWLRVTRALVGGALLVLAWGAVMAALLLVLNTLGIPPHRHVIVRIALYVVGALGAVWLGLVAAVALIVGAFCLSLALTRRQW